MMSKAWERSLGGGGKEFRTSRLGVSFSMKTKKMKGNKEKMTKKGRSRQLWV